MLKKIHILIIFLSLFVENENYNFALNKLFFLTFAKEHKEAEFACLKAFFDKYGETTSPDKLYMQTTEWQPIRLSRERDTKILEII